MASSPITSSCIGGGKVEAVIDLFSWAPKLLWMMTAAIKLEKKNCFLERRLRQTKRRLRCCIEKQKHDFADTGPYSQSYGFSNSHIGMWQLDHKEGWAWKNWGFRIVVLEKTLETARKPNQSTLKEINSEYSLKGQMLTLNLQYYGHLVQRADSLEKTLILGKIEGK